MFNLFNKACLSALLAFLCVNSSLSAYGNCDPCCYDPCPCSRTYVGAFGGWIFSNSSRAYQMGTAFFLEIEDGPLAVYGQGNMHGKGFGFGGVQIGYEAPQSLGCWNFSVGGELEAFFGSNTRDGHLINPTDRLDEHDFDVSFGLNYSVILANAVFSFKNLVPCVTPYVAGGLGAARISLRHANSLQIEPAEPGVNHFDSKRGDSAWTFAAQVKAGIRYNIWGSLNVFGEYRYIFLDASNYILGSTVATGHPATSPWNVKVYGTSYNALVFGVQYDL